MRDERSFRVALVADCYVNPEPGQLDGLAMLAAALWSAHRFLRPFYWRIFWCTLAVVVAGMVARDGSGVIGGDSMYGQAKAIFAKIKHLMEAAGGTMDDIVKVDIFVTDIKRREEVWKARREVFTGDFPVSTLVEVRALAAPELLVEVEAIGILGAGKK